jgi:hypothetical protein
MKAWALTGNKLDYVFWVKVELSLCLNKYPP